MIVINKLEFDNMFSYGKNNSIVLDAHNVTQLVGKNGAGKSSIPTILEEALYNKNSRGTKKADIKNRYAQDNYYAVKVYFTVDGDEYILDKVVKSATSLKLSKNGEDISGHTPTQTYKKLENEILKLDFNTFSKLVYQSMNSSLDFLKATDSERKKFLISLLSLDKYVEIHESLKLANKEKKSEKDKLEGKLSSIKSAIKEYPEKLEPKVITNIPKVDDTLSAEIGKIKSDLENIKSINNQIEKYKEVKNKLDKLEQDLANIEEVQNPEYDITELREIHSDIKSKLSETSTESVRLKNNIQSLKSGIGNCKSCGQTLPNAEDNEAKIQEDTKTLKELESEVNKLKTDMSNVEAKMSEHMKYSRYLKSLEEANNKVANQKEVVDSFEVPDRPQSSEDLESRLDSLKNKLTEQRKAQDKATLEAQEAERFNAKLEVRNEQLDKYIRDEKDATELLSKTSEELSDIKILLDAFGPKGLVQYKIESNIKVFEQLINEYLVKLSNGAFNIKFQIEDSKLKIVTLQDGLEININSASSGEFNNINTATLLAVRKMMTSISKVSLNILFLDEVISVLDVEARENLIDILIKENDLNSVVVSHGFEHPLAETVNIVKEDNISCLTN